MALELGEALKRIDAHAPYLQGCLSQFPDVESAFRSDQSPADVLATYQRTYLGDIADFETEMSRLRILKRAVHLICSLADLTRVWSWVEVTQTLSDLADVAVQRLLRAAAIKAGIEGTDDNPVPGLFIVAMGKHGAGELNYSSDIDFTVFYDPEHISLPNMDRAERTLVRLCRDLIKGLEFRTSEGYVFRADLRLRPDPRSNAIVVSTRTAERYYETLGQNWERAALIKARICAGDIAVGETFKADVISPFIWRRSLDYAAIDDIQSIKRQMDARSGGNLSSVAGHNVKLGHGGIREIEFYVQLQQLILGGRYPDLRGIRTLDTLQSLTDKGYVAPDTAAKLSKHYACLRDMEHVIQMIRDEQDHNLPSDDTEREALGLLRGFDRLDDFDEFAMTSFKTVSDIYRQLYPEAESLASSHGRLVFTGVDADLDTLQTLRDMGFIDAHTVWKNMASWLGGRIAATRSVRARELMTRLAPRLLTACQMTGQSDRAFSAFGRFFSGLRQGVRALSMFVLEPERLEKLVGTMTLSERVAEQLAHDPSIMDVMVEPDYLNINSDNMIQAFEGLELDGSDFEEAMNHVRRLVKELRFRLTLSAIDGHIDTQDLMQLCSLLAEQTISVLLPVSVRETERVFGPIKGDYGLIGLGKLGGREMRLTSDLDMMLLYQPHPEGEVRVDVYTKLTQRLVSALSAITSEGGLFEVDLTLRPSGRSGPVAVSLSAFESYYADKAWTWEFMALTRARVISSSSERFLSLLNDDLIKAISQPRRDLNMLPDISEMLQRTRAAKAATSIWDIKNAVGGLRDMEYLAQTLWLRNRKNNAQSWPKSTADMLSLLGGEQFGVNTVPMLKTLGHYHHLQQWQSLLELDVDIDVSRLFEDHLTSHSAVKNIISKAELIDMMDQISVEIDRLFSEGMAVKP
ncbi:MAG: bifunctional [glutamine synthetase] adenylyltransferase/[glutamine synthetase]-adenylyl-L-tyrosine phosphorylase [Maricaulaceae bacterium]